MDFRESENDDSSLIMDKAIFRQDVLDSEAIPLQTGNGLGRPRRDIRLDERESRLDGLKSRDMLRQQS